MKRLLDLIIDLVASWHGLGQRTLFIKPPLAWHITPYLVAVAVLVELARWSWQAIAWMIRP